MIKVEGDEMIYLAKSQVAKNAIATRDFEGSWVDGPDGSYFSLRRVSTTTPAVPRLSIPMLSEKVTIFDEKKGPIIVISPLAESKKPIIICSPVVGKKNPLVVTSPNAEGGRPIVICSPVARRNPFSMWSPVLEKVRNPVGSPIVRTKTSIAIHSSMVDKNAAGVTSPVELRSFKRVDSHWVRPGEKTSRLRMFVHNNLHTIRTQAV
jgi:hypothetical protein